MAESPHCSIDILLATHNGAAHLAALLESIGSQTHTDWQLIVRDDGSTDETLDILDDWSHRHPNRMRVLTRDGTKRGAQENFSVLLGLSEAPYFMFCDQDDVWMPEKMALMCRSMHEVEVRRGIETPILVYSDLVVVDRELSPIAASYWKYQRLASYRAGSNPGVLMMTNCATGCASMGNAALRRIAQPIPDEAALHDWWLALVAANLGELHRIGTPTVLYRQHGRNQVGARASSLVGRLIWFLNSPAEAIERTRTLVTRTQRQAAAFADRYDGRVAPSVGGLFRTYAQLRNRSFLERKLFMVRNRIWPGYWLRAAAMWWFT